MYMQIISVFVSVSKPLTVIQTHLFSELFANDFQAVECQTFFVLQGNADFKTQKFVMVSPIVSLHHFKFFQNFVGRQFFLIRFEASIVPNLSSRKT
jgi:hypothetical protein